MYVRFWIFVQEIKKKVQKAIDKFPCLLVNRFSYLNFKPGKRVVVQSILILVEEKIFFRRIVGPYVFNRFVDLSFIF